MGRLPGVSHNPAPHPRAGVGEDQTCARCGQWSDKGRVRAVRVLHTADQHQEWPPGQADTGRFDVFCVYYVASFITEIWEVT